MYSQLLVVLTKRYNENICPTRKGPFARCLVFPPSVPPITLLRPDNLNYKQIFLKMFKLVRKHLLIGLNIRKYTNKIIKKRNALVY